MQITKVYRGPGGKLSDNYWKRDAFNIAGGVDFSFASTTHDYEIAASYARMGTARMIFECHMGLADRGAEIGWLSQYPLEKEVCLPPLTALEVQTTRKVSTRLPTLWGGGHGDALGGQLVGPSLRSISCRTPDTLPTLKGNRGPMGSHGDGAVHRGAVARGVAGVLM